MVAESSSGHQLCPEFCKMAVAGPSRQRPAQSTGRRMASMPHAQGLLLVLAQVIRVQIALRLQPVLVHLHRPRRVRAWRSVAGLPARGLPSRADVAKVDGWGRAAYPALPVDSAGASAMAAGVWCERKCPGAPAIKRGADAHPADKRGSGCNGKQAGGRCIGKHVGTPMPRRAGREPGASASKQGVRAAGGQRGGRRWPEATRDRRCSTRRSG
jgi:hypothetical protein